MRSAESHSALKSVTYQKINTEETSEAQRDKVKVKYCFHKKSPDRERGGGGERGRERERDRERDTERERERERHRERHRERERERETERAREII